MVLLYIYHQSLQLANKQSYWQQLISDQQVNVTFNACKTIQEINL